MKLKGKIKELTALTSAICMLSVPNTTVLAATGTKINSVPLSIESEIEAWDTDSDVTVSTSSSEFDIDDVVITNEPSDEWMMATNRNSRSLYMQMMIIILLPDFQKAVLA